jgi:hypothetical protein
LNARSSPLQRRAQPERALQFALIEHLDLRAPAGTWVSHFPSGGKRNAVTGSLLKRLGTRAGVPDLLILCRGKLFGLELKNGTRGRLSPAQIATHADMRAAGAVVGTAGSIDEALDLLGEWGIIT